MGADDDGGIVEFSNDLDIVQGVLASLSTIASSSVLLTGFIFPSLRREIFFQLILCTSFCDLAYSLVASWGGSNDNMAMCASQGIIVVLFLSASLGFVLMLCVTMFNLLHFQKQYMNLLHMNIIVWTFAILATLLPLSDPHATYYDTLGYRERVKCDLSLRMSQIDDDATLLRQVDILDAWYLGVGSYPAMIIITIMIILVVILYTYTIPQVRENHEEERANNMIRLTNYIMLYPLALIILLGPSTMMSIIVVEAQDGGFTPEVEKIDNVLASIIYAYGLVATLIFFTHSSATRRLWRQWLTRHVGVYFGMEEENALLEGLSKEELSDDTSSRASAASAVSRTWRQSRQSEGVLGGRKSSMEVALDLVDLAINATFHDEEIKEMSTVDGDRIPPLTRGSHRGSNTSTNIGNGGGIAGSSSNMSPWRGSGGMTRTSGGMRGTTSVSGIVIEECTNPAVVGGLEDTLRRWDEALDQEGGGEGEGERGEAGGGASAESDMHKL